MLSVTSLSLTDFRNYASRQFRFEQRIVCICGNNGAGKTNLLDAIHYLCFTKSYFTRDAQAVRHGSAGFRIEAEFMRLEKPERAVCVLRENGRKEFLVDGIVVERFSKHIGHYPCVIIAPDDSILITGGSEERRRFIDSILSQLDNEYLQQLIAHNRVLQQRNSWLLSLAETRSSDYSVLDVLDEQLAGFSGFLFDRRKEFFVHFLPRVNRLYQEIARRHEQLELFYESQLLDVDVRALLRASRAKDLQAARTTAGIHRDELQMNLDSRPFRSIASQGQRKSLLFALKLAELQVLQEQKKFPPLLLLDDVFEKLDEERINNLLKKVCIENEGQVFITDTNEQRLRSHLERIGAGFQLIHL
ncbi:MAG TPA: DNA replication and repair protein RecF [Chitinophagaceae bacterium]|nr:DNA replication and repair protein RecF [Chitinophagaceae bacterium]